MKRMLVVGVLVLMGCSKKAPTEENKESKAPEETKGSSATKDAPAVAPVATRTPVPFATRTLEVKTGAPFTLAKGKVKVLTTAGGDLPLVSDDDPAETSVIISSTKPNGEATGWTLVELATGKTLATFRSLYDSGWRSKKAVVDTNEGAAAVLDLQTGALQVPKVEIAGNPTVVKTRIIVDDARDIVWVFANTAEERAYVGRWSDFAKPANLGALLPYWPPLIASGPSVVAMSEDRRESCNIMLITDGAKPVCEPEGVFDMIGGTDVLANRYWGVSDPYAGLALGVHDQTTNTRTALLDKCQATKLAMLADPPRILAGCVEDEKVKLVVWSPDKTWTGVLPGKHDGWHLEGGVLERPVTVPSNMIGQQPPYTWWLDLETGTMFESPPLTPLMYARYGGMARRFVAQGEKDPKELWWVDLDAGTLEKVATDVACAHDLQSMNIPGTAPDRVLIRCVTETSTGAQRKPGSWSEIVDAKARTRTRIDDFAADHLFADGRAIGLTLTGPRRVAVLAR